MSNVEPAWCCLCGQRHDWGTACDPSRIIELRKQADLVRRLAYIQRRRAAAGSMQNGWVIGGAPPAGEKQ